MLSASALLRRISERNTKAAIGAINQVQATATKFPVKIWCFPDKNYVEGEICVKMTPLEFMKVAVPVLKEANKYDDHKEFYLKRCFLSSAVKLCIRWI